MQDIDRLIPVREVCKARNRCRSSTYTDVAAGLLTQPIKTPSNAWPESEIRALNQARIAGKDDNDIRALVAALHARRVASPAPEESHVTGAALQSVCLTIDNVPSKARGRPAKAATAEEATR